MTKVSEIAFRLYVAGETQNSVKAISNLRALCIEHYGDEVKVEIVDVLVDPTKVLDDGIFMTPTLLKIRPLPCVRIIGNLSDTPALLSALKL